jgi:cytidylate kinase
MTITIISGCPGSGKTTLARELAATRPLGVHVLTDQFYEAIPNAIEPWRRESRMQNETIVRAFIRASEVFSEAEYNVFIDGVVGPWMFPVIEDVLSGFEYVLLSIGLEQARQRVRRRAEQGAGPEETGLDIMHPQFAAIERQYERHVLPTGGRPIEDIVAEYEHRSSRGEFDHP